MCKIFDPGGEIYFSSSPWSPSSWHNSKPFNSTSSVIVIRYKTAHLHLRFASCTMAGVGDRTRAIWQRSLWGSSVVTRRPETSPDWLNVLKRALSISRKRSTMFSATETQTQLWEWPTSAGSQQWRTPTRACVTPCTSTSQSAPLPLFWDSMHLLDRVSPSWCTTPGSPWYR